MTQVSSLSLFSPAKINLFLHITGKRSDGYHNLQTVFRLLDWGDHLEFAVSQQQFNPHQPFDSSNLPLSLRANIAVTDNLADNLITKAAIALIEGMHKINKASLPSQLPVIDIRLDKVLPTGAGLGGGSSNAATTLLALNQLWGLSLTQDELIAIGKQVGADVPIFIFAQDAIAEGIGEQFSAIDLPHQHYLLLNPDAHASTQALFAHPELRRDMPALTVSQINAEQSKYVEQLEPPYKNVFEPVVTQLVTEVAEALTYLKKLESITHTTARLTGTGSSVFLPVPADQLDIIKASMATDSPPCHSQLTQSLTMRTDHRTDNNKHIHPH